MKNKTTILIVVVVVFLLLALAAGGVYYWLSNDKTTESIDSSTEETLPVRDEETPEDALERVKKFDGKEYKITDSTGKIEGRAKIVIDESEEYMKVKVGYFIKINDNFSKTSYLNLGADYNLYGNLQQADQTRNGNGTGAISSALCEKDKWPDMKEMILGDSYEETKMYFDCTWNDVSMIGADTNVFYHQLARYSQPKDFTLDFVTELNKLEIYDTSTSYYEDTLEDGTEYYNYDAETVTQEGEILGTYSLIYN